MNHTFTLPEPCTACGSPTQADCDNCKKAFCPQGACLFLTGHMLAIPCDPRNEDYKEGQTWKHPEALCLACYIARFEYSPSILWAQTSSEAILTCLGPVEPGYQVPAGGGESWVQPARAAKELSLRQGHKQVIEYDTFKVVQLLNFLQANEASIRKQAQIASEILVPHQRALTERALNADSGFTDWSKEF